MRYLTQLKAPTHNRYISTSAVNDGLGTTAVTLKSYTILIKPNISQ